MIIVSSLTSCGQQKNKIIFDMEAKQDILYGEISIDAFKNNQFKDWYNAEYISYNPNPETLDSLSQVIENVSIKIVLGTWCKDSRREVPRFIKILDQLGFRNENLEIIAVNRSKIAPEYGIEKGFVDYVPTFIISRDAIELGRIIESPYKTLEKDLLSIIE